MRIFLVLVSLVSCVLSLTTVFGGDVRKQVVPHVIVGHSAGVEYITTIQLSNPHLGDWSGTVTFGLFKKYRVVTKYKGQNIDSSTEGSSSGPAFLERYGTQTFILSSSEELHSGTVIVNGPDDTEVSIAAFYRTIRQSDGSVLDVVTVPVVPGGEHNQREYNRAFIPVNLKPGQFLGVKYVMETDRHPLSDTYVVETVLYGADGAREFFTTLENHHSRGIDFVDHDAWSLHDHIKGNLGKSIAVNGFTGLLKISVVRGYRHIRAVAFVYEQAGDGTWRYTTIYPTHIER